MDGSSISNKAQNNQENRMIILPKQLEDIPIASEFPLVRHRWNTNEEIASILIAFDKHKEWQLRELRVRPPSGSMLLYSRNKVRYRKDGYCWKKRKDGKTIREDHMKLKVQGLECIYGSYVHSAILPTFHRRCYWLLQEKLHGLNPDIVLVHYLNVPYPDSAKLSIPVLSCGFEKKEWTKDELADQLRPMFSTGRPGDGIQDSEHVIQDTVEAIVQHLIEYQENRVKSRNHKCDLSCDKNCLHSKCCKISPKGGEPPPTTGSVSSTNSNDHGRLVSLLQRNRANRAAAAAAAAAVATAAAAPVSESMLIATTPSTTVTNSSTSNSTDVVPPTTTPVIFNFANIQGSNSLLIVSGQTTNPLSIISNSMTNESMPPAGQTISPPIQSLSSTHSLGTEIKVEPGSTAGSTGTLQHSSSNRAMLPVRMATDIISSETGHQTAPKEAPKKISIKTEPLNIFSPAFHLSHEDVQKTLQAATVSVASDFGSASMDSKDAGTDLTNCDNLTLTTASLQNSDLSLDSLDILDLPDLEKLCSDMNPSSSDHSTFENINRDFITCASCLDTQRTQQQHPVQHEQQHQHHHPQQHTHSSGQTASHHHNSGGQQTTSPPQHMIMQESSLAQQTDTQSSPEQAPITDFCPEWSYTEGSTKVLVTGPWFSTSCSYSCVFGGTGVPALLVQPGVLRCFAPAHEPPGLVTLHVQSEHYIISTTVLFEYKAREKQNTSHNQQDWFSVDEDQLRLMVLERLEQLEKRLNTSQKEMTSEQSQNSQQQQSHDFEWRLVQHITTLSRLPWANNDVFPKAGPGGMTLLHLAGALGYAEVIRSLIHWRSENPSLVLEYEVDAHNVDDYSCTPLMWACAKGYSEAAQTLYHWNRGPLKVCNRDGLLPLMAARHHGHHNLANSIELLEQSHNNPKTVTPRIISVSGTTTTSTESSGTSTSISGSLGDTFLTPDKGIAATASSSVTMAGSFPSAISTSSDDSGTDSLFAGTSSPPPQLPPPPPPYPGSSKLTRRMSEQCLGSDNNNNNSSHKQQQQPPLQKSAPSKRFSVDFVSPKRASLERSPVSESFAKPVRESMSEPHLSSFFKSAQQQQQQTLLSATTTTCTAGQSPHNIPDILMHTDHALNAENLSSTDSISQRLGRQNADNHLIFSMDTDEACPAPSESPLVDGERLSSDDELSKVHENAALVGEDGSEEEAKKHMVTLARQIIDAMPERIKSSPSREDPTVESEDMCRERSSSHSSLASQNSPIASSYGEDSGISTPLGDGLSFEDYRYNDLGTPASSLSPDSTCLPSPYSPYFQIDSPPPTTADFTEYFNAPATYMEKDFSQLTLSDQEQRELYEAAKVIQNAYRQYRDKQQLIQQRQKEIEAAILIQSYYRRYKQYAYFKKMTQAAVLIQSQFRSYYAQKRYKNSRGEIDLSLQNQYRNYKEPERLKKSRNQSVIIQQRFRSHYQRKQPEEMDGNQLSQFVGEAGERELWKLIHSHQVSGNLAVPSPPATAVVATAAPPAAAFGQFTSQGKLPCQRGNPSCQH